MTTVTWTPTARPADGALVYQLRASDLPADMKVIIQFSYTSPGLRFDRAEFAGPTWLVTESSYTNGRGTVKITADVWPNSLDFVSLWFKGSGVIDISVDSITINQNTASVIDPPPFDGIIGAPTLDDFKVNPLPDHLAKLIPEPVLDFIASIYIGAFQRPAEYAGLVYWSEVLLANVNKGLSASESLWALTRDMHWVGTQNGEAGTGLGTSDYIDFVYRNVLGREPDAEGKAYWVDYIEKTPNGRAEFLVHFLNSALQPGNSDGDYVRARMAVSKYYSQEEYSGPAAIESGQTQKLGGVLDSVFDESSAIRAIQGMIDAKQAGGLALSSAEWFIADEALAEWDDDTVEAWLLAQGTGEDDGATDAPPDLSPADPAPADLALPLDTWLG